MRKYTMLAAGALLVLSGNAAMADSWHHGHRHGHGRWEDRDESDYYERRSPKTVFSFNFGNGDWYRPYGYYRPVRYYPEPVYINSPPVIIQQPPVQLVDNQRYCREYQTRAMVGGIWRSGYGTACYQPDGSWQFVD